MGWQDAPLVESSSWKDAPLVDSKEPSFVGSAVRAAGVQGRAVLEGITALPDVFIGTPLAGVANLFNETVEKITGRKMPRYEAPSIGRSAADAVGLPSPETGTERVVSDMIRGAAGAVGGVGIGSTIAKSANPVITRIGNVFAASPAAQTVAGVSGGAAAGITREAEGGPGAQLAAGLIGGMAPALGVAAGSATLRGATRGGEAGRQSMLDRMKVFKDAGTNPSAGQATGSRALQATESGLSRIPGGSGVMVRAGESQADEMSRRIDEIAGTLSSKSSATKGGLTIERGIKDFVERFKEEQNVLYGKLDRYIPKDKLVDVTQSKEALAALNADIPGAPNLSQWFKNHKIQGIEGAMRRDTSGPVAADRSMRIFDLAMLKTMPFKEADRKAIINGFEDGNLPYEALKKLRTLVGNEITNHTLASDVPRSKWKALYAALSTDLELAAKQAGPDAEKAFSRANSFTSAGFGRIDTILDRVTNKDTVEKMFLAATNRSELKEGASTINAVMRSLKPEERDIVKAAFIKRMGIAKPSAQDDIGDLFSSETFLTNWGNLSPEAKMTLFAGKGGDIRKDMDKIAKTAAYIRDGAKVFANPSGTSQAAANIGSLVALGGAIGTGNLITAAALLTGAASANLSARLMTNQNFVKWLAETTKLSPAFVPLQINALAQAATREKDAQVKVDMERYLKAIKTDKAGSVSQ